MGAIVVVGGGIAGLTAAWKLQRAGHDVEVIERERVPGGRMRSERHGDFVLDRGAQFIASGYRNLRGIAAELGVADRIRPVGSPRNAVLRGGTLHPGDYGDLLRFVRSPLLSTRAKLRLPLVLVQLLRHRHLLDPWHPELAAPIDREDMPGLLRRSVGDEAFEYLFEPAFSSTFDSEPEDLSGVFALLALRFLAGGFRLESFDGGTGLLTETLASRLRVHGGREVIAVETEADGARVRYATLHTDRLGHAERVERTLLADAVLVAVPGSLVAGLCPTLTEDERAFFASVRYARGMLAFLLLDRAPGSLPYYGVAFPRREGIGLYGLAADHHKPGVAPQGAGLVNVALREAEARRLWDASDDAIAQFVLSELARTPIGRLAPRETVVHRWDPMLPQFGVGYTRRLAAFRSRRARSPRIAFAGDYLVGPYAEMACASGLRAAGELQAALGKR
jgi:oxygen-dependent protoporphyrinogen oxidase